MLYICVYLYVRYLYIIQHTIIYSVTFYLSMAKCKCFDLYTYNFIFNERNNKMAHRYALEGYILILNITKLRPLKCQWTLQTAHSINILWNLDASFLIQRKTAVSISFAKQSLPVIFLQTPTEETLVVFKDFEQSKSLFSYLLQS